MSRIVKIKASFTSLTIGSYLELLKFYAQNNLLNLIAQINHEKSKIVI